MTQKNDTAKALFHLKKDPHLKGLIARYPEPDFDSAARGMIPFNALIRAIVYQQLSGKAARTILDRFLALYPKSRFPMPQELLDTPDAKLRSAGLSAQKAGYLYDLAAKFLDGTVNPKRFKTMTDAQVYEHVVQVKGVGPWTTDMFLMFTLGRPDVLPTGDLGIQKGMQKLFKLKELPSPEKMRALAKPWEPYRSVASWYLWRLADENNNNR